MAPATFDVAAHHARAAIHSCRATPYKLTDERGRDDEPCTPSQLAALRTAAIGRAMGARPLSSPAKFVDADTRHECIERFSRSMDERSPHVRSSQATFVCEDAQPPMATSDIVLCVVGVAIIFLLLGFLL